MDFEEVDDMAELVDLDREEFMTRYKKVADSMRANSDWYYITDSYKGSLNIDYSSASFSKVTTPKLLGLGRSDFYDLFLHEMSSIAGYKVHQSDYMMWINPGNPYESLNHYIDTADKIEFSLEGVGLQDIETAVRVPHRTSSRGELDTRYMTIWEINQIVFSEAVDRTTWHIRSAYTPEDVSRCFGNLVSISRIVTDYSDRGPEDDFDRLLTLQIQNEIDNLAKKGLDAEGLWRHIEEKWPDRLALMRDVPIFSILKPILNKYELHTCYLPGEIAANIQHGPERERLKFEIPD